MKPQTTNHTRERNHTIKTVAKHTPKKIGPLVSRPGGKSYLARRIAAVLPSDTTVFIEPFLGGGSVFLNLDPSCYQYAALGDIDPKLILVWRAVQRDPDAFIKLVEKIEYTEDNFQVAKQITAHPPSGDRDTLYAAWTYARARMSRGSMGETFAWSERLRGGRPGDLNAWINSFENLKHVAQRLRDRPVGLSCCPAEDIVTAYMHDPRATIYLDPPYVTDTRTARKVYDFEMADDDHRRLLNLIGRAKARVVVSGYHCDMYDKCLSRWECLEFNMPNHAGQGSAKQRRVEVLWSNFPMQKEVVDGRQKAA